MEGAQGSSGELGGRSRLLDEAEISGRFKEIEGDQGSSGEIAHLLDKAEEELLHPRVEHPALQRPRVQQQADALAVAGERREGAVKRSGEIMGDQ